MIWDYIFVAKAGIFTGKNLSKKLYLRIFHKLKICVKVLLSVYIFKQK